MAIELHPGLLVGNAEVDRHHAEVFGLFDRLLEAMHRGEGRKEVAGVLNFLQRQVSDHFRAEEALLDRVQHPSAAAHRSAHREFLGQLQILSRRLAEDGASSQIAIDTCQRLGTWLKSHVARDDGELKTIAKRG